MRWQELTWPGFAEAIEQEGGVCVLPVGVVAPQGDHLPLGSDYVSLDLIAARASEIEPAIVFPPYYFGFAPGARHRPGTIALKRKVMLELLGRVVSEVARNGLKKIILVSRLHNVVLNPLHFKQILHPVLRRNDYNRRFLYLLFCF